MYKWKRCDFSANCFTWMPATRWRQKSATPHLYKSVCRAVFDVSLDTRTLDPTTRFIDMMHTFVFQRNFLSFVNQFHWLPWLGVSNFFVLNQIVKKSWQGWNGFLSMYVCRFPFRVNAFAMCECFYLIALTQGTEITRGRWECAFWCSCSNLS